MSWQVSQFENLLPSLKFGPYRKVMGHAICNLYFDESKFELLPGGVSVQVEEASHPVGLLF